MTKKVVIMEQRYFTNSWLLPCSLRSHRIANPRTKMGFAIFRLCPPATLRWQTVQANTTKNQVESLAQTTTVKH
jgi:hypothetical protein